MNASVVIATKNRPGSFGVTPFWARLTRFLRHPHTLRTVQSHKPALMELARCCITVDDLQADARSSHADGMSSWRDPPRTPAVREI